MNRIDSCIVWRGAKPRDFANSPEFCEYVRSTPYLSQVALFITSKLQPRPRFSASTPPRPPPTAEFDGERWLRSIHLGANASIPSALLHCPCPGGGSMAPEKELPRLALRAGKLSGN